MNNKDSFDWKAPGALDRLKGLWAEGWSASQIAGFMGLTRSAVLGKVRREDLPRRQIGSKPGVPKPRATRVHVIQRPRPPRSVGPTWKPAPASMYRVIAAGLSEPPSRGLSVLDLKDGDCRFVHGSAGNFTFCAQRVVGGHSSFCPYHHSLCYQPPKERANRLRQVAKILEAA